MAAEPASASAFEGYAAIAGAELGRLLARQDREPPSRTYGCCDRTFWAWKFTDFPGARFQEAVYAFAHAACWPLPGLAEGAHSAHLREWAAAGLRYWASIQYRDGSFDEAYPGERSLAATAFTLCYLGEAIELLWPAVREGVWPDAAVARAVLAAGRWLCRNDEHHGVLSNHLAAAAAALDVAGRLCGEPAFLERRDHFLARIYRCQHAEGWYEEYGGADPGYQSHATFYLARIWQRGRDPRLLDSLGRSLALLECCIHPDGTAGGEYGSRNTELYYPAGCEILAPVLPAAARIAAFVRPALAAGRLAGPSAVDAWNLCPQLNNYLFAHRFRAAGEVLAAAAREPLPCQRPGAWHFPGAGLAMRGTGRYHAVVGLSKGGVVKAWARVPGAAAAAGPAFSDCGWWATLAGGGTVSSQALDLAIAAAPEAAGTSGDGVTVEAWTVRAPFARLNQTLLRPWLFVAFRLFTLTLGRWPLAARWVKDLLVRVLVRRRRPAPLVLERRVRLAEGGVEVEDVISEAAGTAGTVKVLRLCRGRKFSAIHMGSARYFQPAELGLDGGGDDDAGLAARFAAARRVESRRVWRCGAEGDEP